MSISREPELGKGFKLETPTLGRELPVLVLQIDICISEVNEDICQCQRVSVGLGVHGLSSSSPQEDCKTNLGSSPDLDRGRSHVYCPCAW